MRHLSAVDIFKRFDVRVGVAQFFFGSIDKFFLGQSIVIESKKMFAPLTLTPITHKPVYRR